MDQVQLLRAVIISGSYSQVRLHHEVEDEGPSAEAAVRPQDKLGGGREQEGRTGDGPVEATA